MLIRDSIILKQYAQITGDPDFNAFVPSLRIIESKYIIPVVSKDLYAVLDKAITDASDADPMIEEFANLLHQCRMAIGPLLCYFHADKADVKFSDGGGMQRSESAGFKNAYQEQRQKFKEANLSEGEIALEQLQEFLEEKREDYPEYLDSDNFKEYKSLFIKTGSEFNKLFPGQLTPYRNYWAMRPKMADVEEPGIKKFLGKDLYQTLKTEDQKKDSEFTDEQIVLIKKLKKAIANLTVALSIPFLNVRIGTNGLTVPAVASFSQDDTQNTRAGIDDKMLSTFITSCNEAATDALTDAQEYITENKTAFSTWIGFVKEEDQCEPRDCLENVFSL